MRNKERVEPTKPGEQRRRQFAPHSSPKRQPDGDPGPNSVREKPKRQQDREASEHEEHAGDES